MSSITLGPIYNVQRAKVRLWSASVSLFDAHGNQVSVTTQNAKVSKGDFATYTTTNGYVGMKMTVSSPTTVTAGKNIGRKNETNVLTQAFKECQAKLALKVKTGYHEQLGDQSADVGDQSADVGDQSADVGDLQLAVPFPMAVKSWEKFKGELQYPLYVQPKFDGVRMIAVYDKGDVKLFTRRLHNIVGFTQIKATLKNMYEQTEMQTFIIDGELYAHGEDLQTISGIVRNESLDEAAKEKLKYFVFDCFDVSQPAMGFEDRLDHLFRFVGKEKSTSVVFTDSIHVEKPEMADQYYHLFVVNKYEGAVYKSKGRPYEFDFNKEKRSPWYLKRKSQDDSEYPISGFSQGKGKDVGCIVFQLMTPNGSTFNCVPNGSYEYRRQLYSEALDSFQTSFQGRLAKVVYEDLSKAGVPLRARIVQVGRDLAFD